MSVHGVGGLVDLAYRLAHRHPASRPLQHLDVVAAVADGQGVLGPEAELLGDVLQAGGLGHTDRREVEPGRPADDVVGAVQAEIGGHVDEVLGGGVRVPDDHPAHRPAHDVVEVGLDHLAGQLAVRERAG